MNKVLIKGALIGGVVVFLWGIISWMVLPFHKMEMKRFNNPNAVAQVIQQNAPSSGVYVFNGGGMDGPGYMQNRDQNRTYRQDGNRMSKGPLITAYFSREGVDFRSPTPFIKSLITQIIAAFIATWLLVHVKGLNFKRSVVFFVAIGLFAGVVGCLPKWNWMGYPFVNTLMCILDLVIGWTLAGLAVVKWALRK